jgi:TetR/AcrR family transcriptional regulator, transcriptional repressor for nem operon
LQISLEEAMGHSRAEKANTHERIVALAAKKFREKGLAGIGIAELMNQAGLTVGGFYKHFDSREQLVAEALHSALTAWKREKRAANGPRPTYESLVDEYLSEAHRDDPATGCPIAALAPDIARTDRRTREMVTQEVERSIDALASLIRERRGRREPATRSRAILAYCAMVGAISTARAVSDEKLSGEILKAVALLLKNR